MSDEESAKWEPQHRETISFGYIKKKHFKNEELLKFLSERKCAFILAQRSAKLTLGDVCGEVQASLTNGQK